LIGFNLRYLIGAGSNYRAFIDSRSGRQRLHTLWRQSAKSEIPGPKIHSLVLLSERIKETKPMITVANRLYVKPEYADAFEKVFRERAGLVDKMEGFISNQVLRPVNEGDPYVVFTFWNSRPDFLNWVRSDEFVKGHAQSGTLPKDAYFKTNVLELHEVLQDSSRPDLKPEPHGGPFNMH
jgi:heme-degrading monooxygenase HmoA